jgi:hypothetical protein
MPTGKISSTVAKQIKMPQDELQRIRHLAAQVRSEYCLDQDLPFNDPDGVRAACLNVSARMSAILVAEGHTDARVVQGTLAIDDPNPKYYAEDFRDAFGAKNESDLYRPLHYWVQIGTLVIDITADQFNDELESEFDYFEPVTVEFLKDLPRHQVAMPKGGPTVRLVGQTKI